MKKLRGDVAWFLPNSKKPFAYSTKATSDLICILYEDTHDLLEVYKQVNYDEDALKILEHYLDNGYKQINLNLYGG